MNSVLTTYMQLINLSVQNVKKKVHAPVIKHEPSITGEGLTMGGVNPHA